MAQTTGAMSTSAALVEVSTDGLSWTSAGPCLVSTSYSGGEQLVGEQNTQDGKAPVVTHANKHSATTVEVTALYTEVSTERSEERRVGEEWRTWQGAARA